MLFVRGDGVILASIKNCLYTIVALKIYLLIFVCFNGLSRFLHLQETAK